MGARSGATHGTERLETTTMNQHAQRVYVLGHEPEELRRLILQAAVLQPITARLLQNPGIGPGMRVLNLGCGAGDVTMTQCGHYVPRTRL
jgi:tRNA A58 N-methylase Trm61